MAIQVEEEKKVTAYREIKGDKLRLNFHLGQAKAWDSRARFPVILGGTQLGKCLKVDTPIPTPEGFVEIQNLRIGDTVYDEFGGLCDVLGTSPIYTDHKCYEITFDDGSKVIADSEHLWTTQTYNQRKNQNRTNGRYEKYSSTITTEQLYQTQLDRRGTANHSIPLSPLYLGERAELPIPPYTLGAWLGDGLSRGATIFSADSEIMDNIKSEGVLVGAGREMKPDNKSLAYAIGKEQRGGKVRTNPLLGYLRELNLIYNKHIPNIYMRASLPQRAMLLRGIMDTDGSCSYGCCEITVKQRAFIEDIKQLLLTLGIKSHLHTRNINGCDYYRLNFSTSFPIFKLSRKKDRLPHKSRQDMFSRYIRKVEPTETVPVCCIWVNSESSLYLAGRDYIPTHNTCFSPDWLEREIREKGPGDYLAVTATFPLLNLKLLPEFRYVFESLYRVAKYKEIHGSRYLIFNREKKNSSDEVLFDDKAYEEAGVRETRIVFGSATNPESLESATAKAAVLDECGMKQWRRDSWEAVLRRLSLARGRALLITTLYGYGWLKDEVYDQWVNGNQDFDIIQVDSIVNPAFPRDEWDRAKASLPAWKFDLFYRGRFAKPAGMIYDCFDSSEAVIDPFKLPEDWPVYVGHDFGSNNMASLWFAQDPATGYFYCFNEYLQGGKATFEHVNEWLELAKGHRIAKRVGGSHQEVGWRNDFSQAGWAISEPTELRVAEGIQKVYGFFKTNKLFIFRSCQNLVDEINSYSYELDDKYQPTEKIENKERYHLCDCARYVLSDFNPVRRKEVESGGYINGIRVD